jgi:hypothetical protein
MSGFINYNNRDISLPSDCKDLIELLRRQDYFGVDPRLEDFEIARDEVLTGALSDLETHVQAFCKFRGPFSELRITEPDDQINVWFNRWVDIEPSANISIPPGSPHQHTIRRFLKSRHLEWPEDSEFPKTIFPAIPVQIFREITPLPAASVELSRLAGDFFLHLGLDGHSTLLYRHWVIAKKG